MFEAGEVSFPRNAPWPADMLHELLAFPFGRHDDQVDSIGQYLRRARDRSQGEFIVDWGDDQPGVLSAEEFVALPLGFAARPVAGLQGSIPQSNGSPRHTRFNRSPSFVERRGLHSLVPS